MNIVHSFLLLQPGLYLLRHPGRGLAPIGFSVAPDSEGGFKTLATNDGILRSSKDCVVAHVVDAPVRLAILAYLGRTGDEVPQLRLDRVGLDDVAPVPERPQPMPAPPPAAATRSQFEVPARGISLIGHVERSGDRMAAPGTVLGSPNENLRLEGFQVVWPDRPADVELVASVVVEGHGGLAPVGAGHFCGTRNVGGRIVELTLSLEGAGASNFELDGTAYFSGNYEAVLASGNALSGPSGLEHLTGLKLAVVPARKHKPKAWDAAAGARIFRANEGQAPEKRPASTNVESNDH